MSSKNILITAGKLALSVQGLTYDDAIAWISHFGFRSDVFMYNDEERPIKGHNPNRVLLLLEAEWVMGAKVG